MKTRQQPLRRLGNEALVSAASAAGYANVCEFETSEDWHRAAISRWMAARGRLALRFTSLVALLRPGR